jgi:hypothetical protein
LWVITSELLHLILSLYRFILQFYKVKFQYKTRKYHYFLYANKKEWKIYFEDVAFIFCSNPNDNQRRVQF